MKKISGSLFLATLLSVSFVSAADRLSEGLSKGMNQVLDIIKAFLGPFFSAILGGTGDVLFQKVLFLVIILLTVQLIVKNIPVFKGESGSKNGAIVWIISVSVSLLATRFVTVDLLKTMLLPYTTLGVALTAILPFIIYYVFVSTQQSSTLRRIMWILYGVTFLVIWSSRYAEVGAIAWIYFGTAMLAFFFFLFDGTIRRIRWKYLKEQGDKDARIHRAVEVEEMIKKLRTQEDLYKGNKEAYSRRMKELQNRLKAVYKGA